MGIEQIQPAKTKALHARFSVQLESKGVKSRRLLAIVNSTFPTRDQQNRMMPF